MKANRRKKLLVDRRVQGAILKRVFVYWLFCALFLTLPLVMVDTLSRPHSSMSEHFETIWSHHWLLFVLATLLLPLALLDALRLSNGFVGPVSRLRRELERHAARPDINFAKFRKSDFWGDLANETRSLGEELDAGNGQPADRVPETTASDLS